MIHLTGVRHREIKENSRPALPMVLLREIRVARGSMRVKGVRWCTCQPESPLPLLVVHVGQVGHTAA
jgi:hypothetical protein